MNSSKKKLLAVIAALVLAAVPMLLILETDDPNEGAANAETSAPEKVTALQAPSDLPPIVYAGNVEGEFKLFATGEDGGDPVEILEEPASDPAWTPDGEGLLFVGEADGLTQKRLGIHRIGPDKGIELVKKGPQIPSRMSFRGDTDEIALQSTLQTTGATAGIKYQSSVDSLNLETGAQRTLFEAKGSAYQPAWSPDGSELLVVAGEAGCRSEGICPQRIELLDPRGSPLGTLTDSGAAGNPNWSPDGERIAFTWNRGDGPGVWVMSADGSGARQVTKGKPAVSDPKFSPDGGKIVFSRSCDLFVQSLSGGRPVNITRTPEVCEITPDWRETET